MCWEGHFWCGVCGNFNQKHRYEKGCPHAPCRILSPDPKAIGGTPWESCPRKSCAGPNAEPIPSWFWRNEDRPSHSHVRQEHPQVVIAPLPPPRLFTRPDPGSSIVTQTGLPFDFISYQSFMPNYHTPSSEEETYIRARTHRDAKPYQLGERTARRLWYWHLRRRGEAPTPFEPK